MAAPAPGTGVRGREHTAGLHRGKLGRQSPDAVGRRARRRSIAALPNRVGERDQVVLIGVGGQWTRVAHEFPPAWRGDPTGVADAQIPGMRLPRGGKRTDHSSRIRVDERQRRHRVVRAPGPATATGNGHDREAIVVKPPGSADTRMRTAHDV